MMGDSSCSSCSSCSGDSSDSSDSSKSIKTRIERIFGACSYWKLKTTPDEVDFSFVTACTRCAEHDPVPGKHDPSGLEFAVVGEAPGAREAEQKEPFVGPSGKLLDDLLRRTGLGRPRVKINRISCWKPPAAETLEACEEIFHAQMLQVPPFVLLVGGVAAKTWWPSVSIERHEGLLGFWPEYQVITCVIRHPSSLLRTGAVSRTMRALIGFKIMMLSEEPFRFLRNNCVICGTSATYADQRLLGWCGYHKEKIYGKAVQ